MSTLPTVAPSLIRAGETILTLHHTGYWHDEAGRRYPAATLNTYGCAFTILYDGGQHA